jgi:hypothetical protein
VTSRLSRFLADRGLLRRRGVALLLALAIELLLALLLFFLAPPLPGRKEASRTTVFGIEAPKGEDDSPERSKAQPQQKQRTERKSQPVPPQTQPPPPVPTPLQTPVPPGPPTFLKLTRNDYRASDIAKAPSQPATSDAAAGDAGTADAGAGTRGGSAVAGRKGRHGETLYVAEWVREPTNAQLQPYISPSRARFPGYGLVACRTAPRNRVEDCYELEETRGTGFAGSVRQAAFQFLVRAPRVGTKLMVGEWVMIRIDYTRE